MKKTILISGINGFLASNLVNLLKNEYVIYGIGKVGREENGIQIFSSESIDDINIIPDFLILCHASVSSGLVTQSNLSLFYTNVTITEKIIQKFINSKVIYVSSASIYDLSTNLVKEDSSINPKTDYAISKQWAELIVFRKQNSSVIRLSSLFGTGMKENTIIPNYVNQALNKGSIEVWGKGHREQNYIHVYDACKLIKAAIENFDYVKREILLGVSKREYSNSYLAQIISEFTNSKVLFINEDNSKSIHYNNSKTCELLQWVPKANFKEEIHNYIKWKKEQF